MKKVKIFICVFLAIATVFLFYGCKGSVIDERNKEIVASETNKKITVAEIGFNQWIPVKFFGGDVSFSEAIASAENKCLIIKKGSMQFDNNSVKKTVFIKDGFGNVFGINIEIVYPNVVSGQPGAYIPASNDYYFTKEAYDQLWTNDGNPSSVYTDGSIRGNNTYSNVIYLHLTAEQMGLLYGD